MELYAAGDAPAANRNGLSTGAAAQALYSHGP